MIPFFENFRNTLQGLVSRLSDNKLFWFLVFILAFSLAFFLGRLSKIFEERPIFSLEEMPLLASSVKAVTQANTESQMEKFAGTSTSTIVASRKGTKYHFVWCKSAATIKQENRIYFKTEDEAKATGRTLASSCK
jgi:hypothetical protein